MPDFRFELMTYRLNNAKEKLHSSKLLFDSKEYKDSINRSYYGIFSAIRAILALDCIDYSKHAGVISYFQKEYVKTGIFDKKYSKYVSNAFQIRNNCDYTDFFLVSKEDAEEQLCHAEPLPLFEDQLQLIMKEYLNVCIRNPC